MRYHAPIDAQLVYADIAALQAAVSDRIVKSTYVSRDISPFQPLAVDQIDVGGAIVNSSTPTAWTYYKIRSNIYSLVLLQARVRVDAVGGQCKIHLRVDAHTDTQVGETILHNGVIDIPDVGEFNQWGVINMASFFTLPSPDVSISVRLNYTDTAPATNIRAAHLEANYILT